MLMLDQIPEVRGLPRLRVFRELLYAQYHRIVAHLPVDGVNDLGEPVILASLLRCQHIEDVSWMALSLLMPLTMTPALLY